MLAPRLATAKSGFLSLSILPDITEMESNLPCNLLKTKKFHLCYRIKRSQFCQYSSLLLNLAFLSLLKSSDVIDCGAKPV